MTNRIRTPLFRLMTLLVVASAVTLSFSCGETASGTDSSSHWLSPCTTSRDCGGLECLCGLCTRGCATSSDCAGLGSTAACATADALGASCNDAGHRSGLCAASCTRDADCSRGHGCVNGFCESGGADAGRSDASSSGGAGGRGGSGGAAGGASPLDATSGDASTLALLSCAASPSDPTCSSTPRLTFSTPVVRGPGDSGTFAPGDPITVSFTVTNDDTVNGYAYPCFGLAADDGVVGVKPDVSIYAITPGATVPYAFTVQLPSSLEPGTVVHFAAYVASLHVNCATWPRVDFSITVGSRANSGACEGLDAALILPCRGTSTSTLSGVTARLLPTRCSYTQREALAGIDVDYDVSVEAPIGGVVPTPLDAGGCGQPSASGLIPFSDASGGGQRYCVCDVGLCPPPSKTPVELTPGCYPGRVHWEGVNWDGPSDTNNGKGAAFPPGDYVVSLRHAGYIAADAGLQPFEVDASFVVTITR